MLQVVTKRCRKIPSPFFHPFAFARVVTVGARDRAQVWAVGDWLGLPLVGFGFGEGKEGNGVAGAVGWDRKSAVRPFVRS